MRVVSEEQVRKFLDPAQAIAILEAAFKRDYHATVQMPLRTHMTLASGSILLLMPCHDAGTGAAGMKVVTVHESATAARDRVNAQFVLVDETTGAIRGIVEANYLTDIRTAALSAIATRILARPDASTLGLFGTGRQALAHILVLQGSHAFRRVLVCGSNPSSSEEFVANLCNRWQIAAQAVDSDTCAAESDVICTCTTAKTPVFDGRLIRPGTHLNLVGSFQPQSREVDDEVIRSARICVDTYEGALAEAGDLLMPLQTGVISRRQIVADLHELLNGTHLARQSATEITVFKSVGCALADLVIANLLYGLGT
jgi:ornithine cyclodeaminase